MVENKGKHCSILWHSGWFTYELCDPEKLFTSLASVFLSIKYVIYLLMTMMRIQLGTTIY